MASSPAGEGAPEEAPLSEALASPAQELPSLLSTPAAADSPAPAQASAVVMLTVDDDGDGSLPVGGDPEYGEMDGLIDRSTPPPDKVPLGSAVDDGTAGQAPPPPAAVGPSAAHQAFLNLIHWRPPLLTALVFAFVNIFCLLVIHYHFTVLGLLANMVLCAIFAHVLYRLMAQAYLRFTNQRLEPYSAFKQRVGSQYSRVIDLAQVPRGAREGRVGRRRTLRNAAPPPPCPPPSLPPVPPARWKRRWRRWLADPSAWTSSHPWQRASRASSRSVSAP